MESWEPAWACESCLRLYQTLFDELGLKGNANVRHNLAPEAVDGLVVSLEQPYDEVAKMRLKEMVGQMELVAPEAAKLALFAKWGSPIGWKEPTPRGNEKEQRGHAFETINSWAEKAVRDLAHVEAQLRKIGLKGSHQEFFWLSRDRHCLMMAEAKWGKKDYAPSIAIGWDAVRKMAKESERAEQIKESTLVKREEFALVLAKDNTVWSIATWLP